MAPHVEDVEVEQSDNSPEHLHHQGRRILPDIPTPSKAWTENETTSPGENRRLLNHSTRTPQKGRSRLQSGLTLGIGVWSTENGQLAKKGKPKVKTKFEKRRDKILYFLKPPYFILSSIVVMVSLHVWSSPEFRSRLQWSSIWYRREPWRLLTYGAVHANDGHLAINALVALVVGWVLEREQGWLRAGCIWAGGVVGGALGAGVLQPRVTIVGSSAAVYALLTAHIPNVCIRFGHVPLWWFRPLSVLVLVTSDVCWTLIKMSYNQPAVAPRHHTSMLVSQDNVAWSAHVLGAVVGIPLGFILFAGENLSKRHIVICRLVSCILMIVGIVTSTVYYSMVPIEPPT